MAARALHQLKSKRVENEKRPGRYADGGGLYLQVQASAGGRGVTKSWLFRYTLNGRAREMGLGPVHTVPLASYTIGKGDDAREVRGARDLAADSRRLLLAGIDPIEARAARVASEQVAEAKSKTFKECAEAYIKANRAGWKNEKHADQWANTLRDYAYYHHDDVGKDEDNRRKLLRDLPVSSIDTGLVLQVLEPIWQTKTETASRLRGRIENILNWATVRGHRSGLNPARWRGHLGLLLLKRSKAQSTEHHAALPFAEIGRFMRDLRELRARDLDERGEAVGPSALEFLILTAARTGEVIAAKPEEFDLEHRSWTIPGARMKAKEAHRVPLSHDAAAIIEAALERRGDFVFPGRQTGGLSNMALLKVLERMGRDAITVHGFRSTFREWAAERTSFPREVIEMALAHKIKGKSEEAYWRGDIFEKRRKLMDAWAAFLREPAATVHSIHEQRDRRVARAAVEK